MMMKYEVSKLRDTIFDNIDYLSTEYQPTNDILSQLNRMINWDSSHSLIFQWWVKNEDSINTINELLEKIESNI